MSRPLDQRFRHEREARHSARAFSQIVLSKVVFEFAGREQPSWCDLACSLPLRLAPPIHGITAVVVLDGMLSTSDASTLSTM